MAPEKAYRVTVHGNVTGVGFRFSAIREAGAYGNLKGHVRNVDSRNVECVVQGPQHEVNDMVNWLRHGPGSARITECKVNEIPLNMQRQPFHIEY